MKHKVKHLGDETLQILVTGDEQSAEFLRTAQHVETCDECQRRLQELVAPGGFESSVSSMLGNSSRDAWGSSPYNSASASKALGSHVEAMNLDFLSPPSHPEMLGRLGRYEIERVIGSGGMGIVLKAFDTELHRPVAVKVLARHLAHSGAAKARFAREAKAAAAVVHEHVVSIHNVEADHELPFLVMQFVSGESLQARVDRVGPLEGKEILRIAIQIASGLAAAHEQGVIHRDIKPANILLEDRVERALITDFGLARTVDDASLTHTGVIAGTPHYMSPQQANGDTTDHRTDLFSLGSVLYFMATGHPPFRAERAMGVLHRICQDRQRPVGEINCDIPVELSKCIDRLLEKKPQHRYATASDVEQTLCRLLASWQQGGLRRRQRFSRQWLMYVVAAGLAVAIGTIALFQNPPQASRQSPLPDSQVGEEGSTESSTLTEVSIGEDQESIEGNLRILELLSSESRFANPEDSFEQIVESVNHKLDVLDGQSSTRSSVSPRR
jgi:eukaryotic-like serine/threonine-protein kinase